MKKDKRLIPVGHYCYLPDITFKGKRKLGEFPIVNCPYSTTKSISGVRVPYCEYLKEYGFSNNFSDKEFEKLVDFFGTEEAVFDKLKLDLLWDGVKECGINIEDEIEVKLQERKITEKEAEEQIHQRTINWIKKVKK